MLARVLIELLFSRIVINTVSVCVEAVRDWIRVLSMNERVCVKVCEVTWPQVNSK